MKNEKNIINNYFIVGYKKVSELVKGDIIFVEDLTTTTIVSEDFSIKSTSVKSIGIVRFNKISNSDLGHTNTIKIYGEYLYPIYMDEYVSYTNKHNKIPIVKEILHEQSNHPVINKILLFSLLTVTSVIVVEYFKSRKYIG